MLLKHISRLDPLLSKAFPSSYSLALSWELTLLLKGMLTPRCSRRERDDGDQVPLFASPEGDQSWIDRGSEDRAACFSRTPSPESDALDATTLGAATDLLEGLIDDLSTTEASDLMLEEESIDKDRKKEEENGFNELGKAASFNTARPPDPLEVSELRHQYPNAGPLLDHLWITRYFQRADCF